MVSGISNVTFTYHIHTIISSFCKYMPYDTNFLDLNATIKVCYRSLLYNYIYKDNTAL